MSIKTNFLADGTTVYNHTDFMMPWAATLTPGVINGLYVHANNPFDMSVIVEPGIARVGEAGYIVNVDSPVKLDITANTSDYGRFDLIVIDVDTINNVTALKVLEGNPSPYSPEPNVGANQLQLAKIYIQSGEEAISNTLILNAKTFSGSKLYQPWIPLPNCTYKSATSFTIAEPMNKVLDDGDPIYIVQLTGTKIGWITDVWQDDPQTTITITGNKLDNGDIIAAYFMPRRGHWWFNYTPTVIASSGAVTNLTLKVSTYTINNGILTVRVRAICSLSAASKNITITLPIDIPFLSGSGMSCGNGFIYDDMTKPWVGAQVYTTFANTVTIAKFDGSSISPGDNKEFSFTAHIRAF